MKIIEHNLFKIKYQMSCTLPIIVIKRKSIIWISHEHIPIDLDSATVNTMGAREGGSRVALLVASILDTYVIILILISVFWVGPGVNFVAQSTGKSLVCSQVISVVV